MPNSTFTWTKERLAYLFNIIHATYVEKVAGKGLSTEDFTSALLSKLNGIESGADVNAIESIKLAGVAQTPDVNKAVNIPAMTGANASNNGAGGLVPAPAKGNQDKFLKGDGSWGTPTNTDTTYTLTQDVADGHKFTLAGSDGYSVTITIPDDDTIVTLATLGIANVKNYDQSKAIVSITRNGTTFTYTCLDGTSGTFDQQDNNTWNAMVGATSSAAGSAGYVPAPPKDGYNTKYLRADGTWEVPPDTNTEYNAATGDAPGLMSASDKSKLDGIAEGATANTGTITGINMNGASKGTSGVVDLGTVITAHQDISGKANLASPTFTGTPAAPTPDASNNSTQIATTAFVATAIANAISGVTQIRTEIVVSLPATGEAGVIYFVAHAHGTSDSYDEYIWTGTAFEKIGHTDVDLSGYMQTADYPIITEAEIDEIVASV